jgi:hypothetical protein
MGRLSGCMNDDMWSYLVDCLSHRLAIAYVELMVVEASNAFLESPLVPACVTLGTEKHRTLIIVYPMDFESSVRKIQADLGSDQTIGTGYQHLFIHNRLLLMEFCSAEQSVLRRHDFIFKILTSGARWLQTDGNIAKSERSNAL